MAVSEDATGSARSRPPRLLPPALLLAALFAAYWAPAAVVGTRGDFPLNDDWAYARTVSTFLETGRLDPPAWAWAPAVPNVLLGAAFRKALGGSFESLRWSTLCAGFVGVLGAFALARQLRASVPAAAVAALTLAWNPLHLDLAFTFMTDVLFTALTTWSLVLLARGLETGGRRWLAGGLVVTALALLSRSAGPALPAALVGAIALERIHTRRSAAWALAVAVPLAVAVSAWLVSQRGVDGTLPRIGWVLHERMLGPGVAHRLGQSFASTLPLLGLSVLPLLPLALGRAGLGWKLATGAAATGLTFLVAHHLELTPPFSMNVWWDLGLGAKTLPGADLLPSAPRAVLVATALGCLLGGLALAHLGSWLAASWRATASSTRLALLFVALYLGPLALQSPYFDRWLLPVLPPLAALLLAASGVARPGWRRWTGAGLALAVLLGVGTAGTHDMMARHRARWDLIAGLLALGVGPGQIDGGFEFNGMTKYDPVRPRLEGIDAWIGDPVHRLSYATALPGYTRVTSRSYRRWLPPGEGAVHLYLREDPEP
jgi:4-amino-4-deoxy-L-arabinose transferase-like glycosyltransferase